MCICTPASRYIPHNPQASADTPKPAAIQEYLLATARLDRFCASLCEAVCPGSGQGACQMSGQDFLDWLNQAGLFVIASMISSSGSATTICF